jgi:casein kinase II subunit alpha
LIKKLGEGTYGEAYSGLNINNHEKVVIKILNPDHFDIKTTKREALIMQILCHGQNILKIYDIVEEEEHKHPALVVEYIHATYYKELYPTLNTSDIKYYMKAFLQALEYVHQHQIIHRDIKPGNILIDPQQRKLRLIDFGFASFHYPGCKHGWAGTRMYVSPELIIGYEYYDYKVDIWSFGVMFAELIFNSETHHWFREHDRNQLLITIFQRVGLDQTKYFLNWMQSKNISYNATQWQEIIQTVTASIIITPPIVATTVEKEERKQPTWKEYVTDQNRDRATLEALEVLQHSLQ